MTCIATDGKTMAGDGRGVTLEKITADEQVKVRRLKSGELYGFAGSVSDGLVFGDWLDQGAKGDAPKVDKTMQALVLGSNGLRYYAGGEDCGVSSVPAAIGSGGDLAIGAMLAGKKPADAVAIAAQRDPFVGGQIIALVLGD